MSLRELLRSNDERFLGSVSRLSSEEWSAPSLCAAWTNHDVLAHLVVGYSCGLGTFAVEICRQRGRFDPANEALTTALSAARTPELLLDDFTRLADRPKGLGALFPRRLHLGDHVTHELDILYALDLEPDIHADALAAVLNTQVAVPNPFVPAFRNSRGLRLRATDIDWTHGENGPIVEGRAAVLVSVLGSRPRMLSSLQGDGVEVLASRVSPRQIRRAG